MTRSRWTVVQRVLLTACVAALFAVQATSQGDVVQQAWDAGDRYPDWSQQSTLELVNGCQSDHAFSVTKANADFLDFLFTSPVRVPGKSRITVPVRFHTNGMGPGVYTGGVTVICTDCMEKPACTQDRTRLAPRVTVIARGAALRDNTTVSTDCSRDCGEILKRLNEISAQVKAQQRVWSAANSAVLDIHRDMRDLEKEIEKTTELALKTFDNPKAGPLRTYLAKLHQDYQKLIDDFQAASRKADEERAKLDALKAQEAAVLKEYQTCLTENGFCQAGDAPKPCTRTDPCTSGWTECGTGANCYPEMCTSDHPCTTGSTVKTALKVTKSKTPCTRTREDCERLSRLAAIKEAEARAAEQTAADAGAEAARQEAAAGKMAGKDPRDVVAQQAIARSARDNATTLERAAARIRAAATAARKESDDCLARIGSACASATTSGRSGGTAGARNCDSLRLAWQEAERRAVLAQLAADEASRNQNWNKSDADYLDSQAAKDEAYAKGQTDRARQYRELGGTARGLAMRDREIAARSAPGSKDQLQWGKAAADDEADAVKWNADADAAEATELQYHMKAAAGKAKAAQLRGSPASEKAAADQAKAAAAAAKKTYEACAGARPVPRVEVP